MGWSVYFPKVDLKLSFSYLSKVNLGIQFPFFKEFEVRLIQFEFVKLVQLKEEVFEFIKVRLDFELEVVALKQFIIQVKLHSDFRL